MIRRRTIWLIALLVFVTLASVGVAVLAFAPEIVRHAAIIRLESLTRRRVSIDRVELSVASGHVAFHGLRVADREGPGMLATIDRIEGRVHRRSLLRLQVWIEELAITGAQLNVVRLSPTRFNISDLLERPAARRTLAPVTIDRLRIVDSTLTFEDRTLTPARAWKVERIAVDGRALSTTHAGGSLEVRSVAAGAPLYVRVEDVRLVPLHLRAHVSAANIDLGLLRLYLPGDAALLPERGVVAAGITVVHDALDGTRLSAGARVRDIVVHRRGQDGPFATSPEITLTLNDLAINGRERSVARVEIEGDLTLVEAIYDPAIRYAFTSTRLVIEELTWPLRRPGRVSFAGVLPGGGRLDVRGTLASPLRTDLSVRASRLPVDLANRYARLAGTLGGVADVDVRVVAAWENRQLRLGVTGAVGATRLTIADPSRPDDPPLGVERLDASALDYQWPSRLTVGFVNLRKPWATVARDAAGAIAVRRLLIRQPAGGEPGTAGAPAPPPASDVTIGELRVHDGTLTVLDATVTPAARLAFSGIGVSVKNAGWPARGPAQIALDATLPGGGTLTANGTGELDQRVVRVKVGAKNVDLTQAQPYLPIRGRLQGRVDADLDVRGRLDPPRMRVRGTVGATDVALADGGRQLLTIARLDARGVDYRAPVKLAVDDVRIVKPWALIDRNDQGQLSLRAALTAPRPAPVAERAPAPTDAALKPEVVIHRALFEDGGTNVVDDSVEPAARFQVRGTQLEVRNFSWPVRMPAEAMLATPMPRGGRLEGRGTFQVDPPRIDLRVTLSDVALSPAQPYLPMDARLSGNVDGEAQITARFEPFSLAIRGAAAVKELGIGDANRHLLTAGRTRAEGIDVQWPGAVRVTSVEIEKPWVLFEREASGRFPLVDLLTPRVRAKPAPSATREPGGRASTEPLRFSLGRLALTDGFGRFVDRTTEPDFAEELSAVNLTLLGVGNTPSDNARMAVRATLGPSAPLSVSGELGSVGAPPRADVLFTLGGYAAPRANAYLDTLFGWTARRGSVTLAAHYRIDGDDLDATNDAGIDGLVVVRSPVRAKPPKWPIGLPLDTFVSLLKDRHGHVELSIPVHGRLSSPEFDLGDAIWSALRSLAFKTVGLPFALIGKLMVTPDSRIESLSVNPVTFLPGTATPRPEMGEHLDRLAQFLRDKPAIRVRLRPVLVVADVEPLKLAALRERLRTRARDGSDAALREQALRVWTRRFPKREPPASLDELLAALAAEDRAPAAAETALGERRVAAVRDALAGRGVEAGRLLAQSAPAAVEGEGIGRVEFEITP